jgi:cyclopropane-fatty-acyl-phospholipid synthase
MSASTNGKKPAQAVSASVARTGDALAARLVKARLKRATDGQLRMQSPSGKAEVFGRGRTTANFQLRDRALWPRLLVGGEVALGETYSEEFWDSDDLVALLEWGLRNRASLQLDGPLSLPARLRNTRFHRGRRNTPQNSRANIESHYDLGNEFYAFWLDEEMNYSSAIFEQPDEPLEKALANKHRVVCEKLEVAEGQRVLDIGCGWGAHAIYSATHFGALVDGITISPAQLAFGAGRVRNEGLEGRVKLSLCDYRDARGQYDRVVSMGMLEHVGAEYFETYFQTVERLLRPGGRALIQAISVPDRSFEANRRGSSWVQRYIFPGGVLPSIAAIERALATTSLVMLDVEDIGQHMASTTHCWHQRYLAVVPALEERGYDRQFIRSWEYFLAACVAGFRTRNQSDIQVVLEKPPYSTSLRRYR